MQRLTAFVFVTFVTFCILNGQETKTLSAGKNLAIVATPSGSFR